MENNVDFLNHLMHSEAAVKDWPAWKRDIWPENSQSQVVLAVKTVRVVKKPYVPQALELLYHRHK